MYYFDDYEKENVVDGYQRSVRDRANENLKTLKGVFDTPSRSLPPQDRSRTRSGKDQLANTVHPRILTYQDDGRPQKYTVAATQLESMLSSKVETLQIPQKTEAILPKPQGPLPSLEEAATNLQHQAVYIQQLESENRYIKEEMAVLKMKVTEVLQENNQLHNELKTTVVHEILREGGEFAKHIGSLDDVLSEVVSPVMTRHDFRRWQIELERLSSLHATKTERLESQLAFAKSEIEKLEKTVDDLKAQLRMQDSIPTRENGLIADYSTSGTHRNIYQQTINGLTKERDELMDHLTSVKTRLRDMSQREEELYLQMKKSIELVEQAQLEQTEALVQKEQLAEELRNMRQRFEVHVLDTQKKMQLDRESVRGEMKFLLDDLNNKLKESVEKYTAVENQLEKVTRDKMSLSNELDEIKAEFRLHTKETTVTSDTFRQETTNASLQRQSAVQTAHQLRTQLENLTRERDQERSRMKSEIDDLRRRLHLAERDLVNSKEECILLTTNAQSLERELHLAKLARESIERGRSEDVKIISKQSQQREEHYKEYINNMEEKHAQVAQQMDSMLHKQNRLIMKLREECKRQALHLEKYTKKYRKEIGHVTAQYEELKLRFEKTVSRLEVLEEQEDQHNRVHEKMKERLKKMDEYAQFQSKQILDTLGSLSRATRDRQLLAREVDFLRNQLNRVDSLNVSKLNSSSKQLVDEILNTITKEQLAGKGHLLLDPDIYKIELPERVTIDDLV